MTLPVVTDWLAAQRVMPPLDADDARLVLDLDFRTGSTAINAKMTTEGFTHTAGAESWDTTLGWNPGGTGKYVNLTWTPSGTSPSGIASRAAIGDNFSIYFEVQRSAIARTFVDNASSFIDNTSGPSDSAAGVNPYGASGFGVVFQTGNGAGNFDNVSMYYSTNASSIGSLSLSSRNNASTSSFTVQFHADQLNTEDEFASVVIVCKELNEYWYVDGLLRRKFTRTILPNSVDDIFLRMRFADDGGGATRGVRGYIRRFQLITGEMTARLYNAPRLAFIGDSYVQRGASQATPGAITVAGIDAVQNALDDGYMAVNNNSNQNPVTGTYTTPLFFAIQKLAAQYGAKPRFYAAGDSGHGWGSGAGQIRQAFFDAVGNYDPEILVCLGSVNDVVGNPADLVGDIQSRLTYVAGLCRNLRKIIFVQTFPGWKHDYPTMDTGNWNTAAAIALYKVQIAAQAQLNGYSVTTEDGRTVTVQFVPTYDALGGDDYNPKINLGGAPEKALWKALYSNSAEDLDVHPGQYGMNRMAEVIWPALQPYLINAAGAKM